jgi:hypothetical protein
MLCFETYSQGVVGVGSTAAELEERVQSGGLQAGKRSGTDVSAGNIWWRSSIRKGFGNGVTDHWMQGPLLLWHFLQNPPVLNYRVVRNIIRSGSGPLYYHFTVHRYPISD